MVLTVEPGTTMVRLCVAPPFPSNTVPARSTIVGAWANREAAVRRVPRVRLAIFISRGMLVYMNTRERGGREDAVEFRQIAAQQFVECGELLIQLRRKFFEHGVGRVGGGGVAAIHHLQERTELVIKLRRKVQRILRGAIAVLIEMPFDVRERSGQPVRRGGHGWLAGLGRTIRNLRLDSANPTHWVVGQRELVLDVARAALLFLQVGIGYVGDSRLASDGERTGHR